MSEYGLSRGSADLASVGAITFGPDDILFVADNRAAALFALDVADDAPAADASAFDIDRLDTVLASFLGCSPEDVVIADLDVHPRTHNVYLSVMRGRGTAAIPVIVRIDHRDATISALDLADIAFAKTSIDNAPALDDERVDVRLTDAGGEAIEVNDMEIQGHHLRVAKVPARSSTVTDMACVDGTLLVAGMSNEEFSSNLRRIPFPFAGAPMANSLEIFHVSHGKWETAAPIRTFVPYDDGRSILASYTCTPVVKFSLAELSDGTQARGHTVAELGPMNQPLDMVAYRNSDGEHLLIAHSHHPLMRLACRDIDVQEPLTEPQEPRGAARAELDLPGVVRLANLNGDYVLALQETEAGRQLRSLKTSSL